MSRILVIDDQAEIVSMLSEFLTSLGHDVHGLTQSREGENVFRTFQPDLCLLDLRMPGFSGADLMQQFRAIDSTVEVVFLTGEAEASHAIELMKAGAIDYLIKPVHFGVLSTSVARALEHRQLVCENILHRQRLELSVAEKTTALNEALRSLEDVHTATMEALSTALDFRDQSTSGHSRRVAQWTAGVARRIGVSGAELQQVEQGSLLHDIGKLRIPDSVLLKPGPLNDEEWVTMRRHAEYGRDFLEHIDFLEPAAEIVYSHHERFDGSGYPRGLRREAIPIGARCFTIVDAVDAMIFKRPYNRPVSFEAATDEVRRCAGTQFDPDLVNVALELLATDLL